MSGYRFARPRDIHFPGSPRRANVGEGGQGRRVRMMVSSGLCKTKAEQCAKLTPYVETPRMRVALANVERTWLKLADQCRRLDELNETIESPAIAPLMDNAYSAGANAEEDYTSEAAVAELERIGSAMDKVGSL